MRTFDLTTFLADAERRARETGVADIPVDTLRNKGERRTENKRMLLARAAARSDGTPHPIVSYF
ncbi:MAG: hypothetical protein ACK4ZY_00030 [Sphingomonas sp.]